MCASYSNVAGSGRWWKTETPISLLCSLVLKPVSTPTWSPREPYNPPFTRHASSALSLSRCAAPPPPCRPVPRRVGSCVHVERKSIVGLVGEGRCVRREGTNTVCASGWDACPVLDGSTGLPAWPACLPAWLHACGACAPASKRNAAFPMPLLSHCLATHTHPTTLSLCACWLRTTYTTLSLSTLGPPRPDSA